MKQMNLCRRAMVGGSSWAWFWLGDEQLRVPARLDPLFCSLEEVLRYLTMMLYGHTVRFRYYLG